MTDVASGRRRKAPRPPIEVEVRLLDWGARGSTQAELESRRLQIDRGIPGERVVATVDRRRTPWRGVVDRALDPSADRVMPPCPYFVTGCGGCQWQHMRYEAQLQAKRSLVERELRCRGVDAQVDAIHAMEDPWRYRHTAAIAIGWEAGFRPRRRRGIVEIHDCVISHPLVGQLADALNTLLRGGGLPNYHGKVWLDCTVVGSPDAPELQVVIQGIEGLTLETHPELTEVARAVGVVEGVGSVAYRHRSGEPRPLVGELMSPIEVAGRSMYLPAGSFFQTNLEMLAVLLGRMGKLLDGRTTAEAADIYGGVGTFGLFLADRVERMTLVELDPLAVAAARRTAEAWGLNNLSYVSRHAERALPELPALDLAIVDPPRSGLGEVVVRAVVDSAVPLLLYVSCSPSSLAVDLAALVESGYRVRSLELFDFYPQTYHVESLAVLER